MSATVLMIMQETVLNQFPEATVPAEAAFQLNQSIVTYFYIIITCFNLIITHFNLIITDYYTIITHFYIVITSFYIIIMY